ncbi:hypothetical protein [Actinoallomurus rhizosphaericola]|uniref:hypothetical protein n=1 Tax=Actinoallomurus rhizosphaericola TaxID=2952536 RepID=UPI0020916B58|nr:hypothetical protein [Actinoallomurus rhizosphaericola]MCO5993023.1 hypothetical protein [Actinoallomurus rhizosphaericola]
MDRVLALDERTGDALTALLPAARTFGAPAGAPMPAALVAVRHGPRLLLVFDRHRRQWELARPHEDFVPNREISAIHWWDTTGPPPAGTQILDATLGRWSARAAVSAVSDEDP